MRAALFSCACLVLSAGTVRAIPVSQPAEGSLRYPPGIRVGERITLGRPVKALAAGEDHTLALHDDGSISAWGMNQHGQCEVPADLPQAIMVAAGESFSAALLKDGRIMVWGLADPQPFATARARSINAANHSFAAVGIDGSVMLWDVQDSRTERLQAGVVAGWAAGFKDARQVVVPGHVESMASLASWEGLDHLVFRGLPGVVILDAKGAAYFLAGEGRPTLLAERLAQLSSARGRLVAVTMDGNLKAWGDETLHRHAGKLGKIRQAAAAESYTFALTEHGELFGSSNEPWEKFQVPDGEIASIVLGVSAWFLVYRDGSLIPIGDDYAGQANLPQQPCKITKTCTSGQHTLILRSDGRASGWTEYLGMGWGIGPDENEWYAQASIPIGIGKIRDLTTGPYFTILLMEDETLIGWGHKRGGVFDLPASARGIRSIVSGDHFVVGLDEAGKVHAWGDDTLGQCQVQKSMGKVVQVSAGGNRAHALNSQGMVFSWGDPDTAIIRKGEVARPGRLDGVTAISAGDTHALALRRDGSVVAWGDNRDGACDVPRDLKPCKAICAGDFVSVAIERDTGKAIVWGQPGCEPPDDLPPLKSVSAGNGVMIGMTEGGSLVGWGSGRVNPTAYSIPVGLTGLGDKP